MNDLKHMELTRKEENVIRVIRGTRSTLVPVHKFVSICAPMIYVILPIAAVLAYRNRNMSAVYALGFALVVTMCSHTLLNLQVLILKLTKESQQSPAGDRIMAPPEG